MKMKSTSSLRYGCNGQSGARVPETHPSGSFEKNESVDNTPRVVVWSECQCCFFSQVGNRWTGQSRT